MGPPDVQFINETPPIAGLMAALAVSTTAAFCDLTTTGPQSGAVGAPDSTDIGAANKYVVLYADGGDVYVNFGPTKASVTGANVPLDTQQNTVSGTTGAITAGAKVCYCIAKGTRIRVRPTRGGSGFLGYVSASGTPTLRISVSSQ